MRRVSSGPRPDHGNAGRRRKPFHHHHGAAAPEVMIIARAEQPSTLKKLSQAGATHVVLPAAIGRIESSRC